MRLTQPAWPRALPTAVVTGCATLGILGRRLPAPGTWGSLAGLLCFVLFFRGLAPGGVLVLSLLFGYLAVALCGEAEARLRERDPGKIVLDEVAAMPLCFVGWQLLPAHWPAWAIFGAGFALFRFYDIAKPLGIRRLQDLPGGWGVALDDTAAAAGACVTLHVAGFVAGFV